MLKRIHCCSNGIRSINNLGLTAYWALECEILAAGIPDSIADAASYVLDAVEGLHSKPLSRPTYRIIVFLAGFVSGVPPYIQKRLRAIILRWNNIPNVVLSHLFSNVPNSRRTDLHTFSVNKHC